MDPDAFDHVIGAAANVTGYDEFVVVGSQAILGSIPDPPDSMLESLEAGWSDATYQRARQRRTR